VEGKMTYDIPNQLLDNMSEEELIELVNKAEIILKERYYSENLTDEEKEMDHGI
jgi:uncharacterized membrane protein